MLIFLHSSSIGYLGCFHAVINGAAMNIGVHVSFWITVSQGVWPVVELLGHMIFLFLVFWRNVHNVLHCEIPIYIPTNSVGGFSFLHTLSSIYCLWTKKKYFLYKKVFIFNWRIIALWYCVGFYQTLAWISHRFTHVPSHLNIPSTSLHILPL